MDSPQRRWCRCEQCKDALCLARGAKAELENGRAAATVHATKQRARATPTPQAAVQHDSVVTEIPLRSALLPTLTSAEGRAPWFELYLRCTRGESARPSKMALVLRTRKGDEDGLRFARCVRAFRSRGEERLSLGGRKGSVTRAADAQQGIEGPTE